jgi:FAD/FMN-containing dehydrogenase
MGDINEVKRRLKGMNIEDDIPSLKRKSRDFYWYSPILKSKLAGVQADLIVNPTTEAEVVEAVAAAFDAGIPITPRGGGTGNYGQAMPLAGGMILTLTGLNTITAITQGQVTTGAGILMLSLDQATRAHSSQELRLHPSTVRTATIGGFLAGGSGGVGSIRWGGLRNPGNVLRTRVVTMEASPRILDLTGDDLVKVLHAYGTNGIITEVDMPLAPAYPWVDVFLGFDTQDRATAFASDLAHQDGILIKELAMIAAPAGHDYFTPFRPWIRPGQSLVLTMVAPHALTALATLAARARAEILLRSDRLSDDERKALPPLYEQTWNHTTLRALKIDPTITYLQVLYPAPNHVALVAAMARHFGSEVIEHLEFQRFNGAATCSALPLIRFTTEQRLDEIVRIYEDNGAAVFNPHRYTLEEGGMKQSDPIQLAFKREVDPRGLLNPGKMVAWEDPAFDFSAGRVFLFPGLSDRDGTS